MFQKIVYLEFILKLTVQFSLQRKLKFVDKAFTAKNILLGAVCVVLILP